MMLRDDRRGVVGLPLRIMLAMLILSLSLPMVHQYVDIETAKVGQRTLVHEGEELRNSAARTLLGGNGTVKFVELEIDGELVVGGQGPNSHLIKCQRGTWSTTLPLDSPPMALMSQQPMELSGDVRLRLECCRDHVWMEAAE
jgi:hypothetical protein